MLLYLLCTVQHLFLVTYSIFQWSNCSPRICAVGPRLPCSSEQNQCWVRALRLCSYFVLSHIVVQTSKYSSEPGSTLPFPLRSLPDIGENCSSEEQDVVQAFTFRARWGSVPVTAWHSLFPWVSCLDRRGLTYGCDWRSWRKLSKAPIQAGHWEPGLGPLN
jgi:hypothetical protein